MLQVHNCAWKTDLVVIIFTFKFDGGMHAIESSKPVCGEAEMQIK